MKLLLTSCGVTNLSIAKALFELVGKDPAETRICFIPTAMNATTGDKSWFVKDLMNLMNLNLKFLDIVDISAVPKNVWLQKLSEADVIFFSGGNTTHLMRAMKESGFLEELPKFLESKVYAGISAGSVACAPDLRMSSSKIKEYYKNEFGYENEEGLNLVDFYFSGHLNHRSFPERTEENYREIAKSLDKTLYALDDNSALKIVDNNIEVVSEGKWVKF